MANWDSDAYLSDVPPMHVGNYYDEDYEDNGEDYYYDDEYSDDLPLSELFDQCILPTLSQTMEQVYPLLAFSLVMRITGHFILTVFQDNQNLSRFLYHWCSAICGLLVLHSFFQANLMYLLMLTALAYPLLLVTWKQCRGLCGITVAVTTGIYLVTCELFVVNRKDWHQIRGSQMVLAMKIVSLAFDLDSGTVSELPQFSEYVGYSLHVGTVIFGPWTSYTAYAVVPTLRDRKMDFYWVAKVVISFLISMACLVHSTCLIHWLISNGVYIWFVAYRDAQSFRFSHYFVCFFSEVTSTLSGVGASASNGGDVRWDLTVTRPLHTELPRSLVDVVTNWNLPMHQWLKTYVFKTAKSLGNLPAILLTYAASSLLHGLNFQLSAVLLSLGFYSYIEHVLRSRLARVFDACILPRRCKPDCQHKHKTWSKYVVLANVFFGLLSAFHLAYLGLMFDSSSQQEEGYTMEHTLAKWAELSYASHWAALATYVFYLFS